MTSLDTRRGEAMRDLDVLLFAPTEAKGAWRPARDRLASLLDDLFVVADEVDTDSSIHHPSYRADSRGARICAALDRLKGVGK